MIICTMESSEIVVFLRQAAFVFHTSPQRRFNVEFLKKYPTKKNDTEPPTQKV
jgi:hypothetical protein